jgi:hypothetical protein
MMMVMMVIDVMVIVVIIMPPRHGHRHRDAPGHVQAHQSHEQETNCTTHGRMARQVARRSPGAAQTTRGPAIALPSTKDGLGAWAGSGPCCPAPGLVAIRKPARCGIGSFPSRVPVAQKDRRVRA